MATSDSPTRLSSSLSHQSAPRIGFAVSDANTVRAFLRHQLHDLQQRGLQTYIFCGGQSDVPELDGGGLRIHVPFLRQIHPWSDGKALIRLLGSREFRQLDILNASTPKAGLVGMLAGWLCRIPVRIYLVRGLRYETATGWKRQLLMSAERVACACAHRVVCISESVRRELIASGLVSARKTCVLGSGSSNGVRFSRFAEVPAEQVAAVRDKLGIPIDAPVIGFVGRLTRDKGISELWSAFQHVRQHRPDTRLLIVGDFEAGDPVPSQVQAALKNDSAVHITGFVSDTAPYFPLMSVLAFPSYREGFPNVILEASCAAVPAVGFAATGTIDAIQDGRTGLIVPLGDPTQLACALLKYLADDVLRVRHGRTARDRAQQDFVPERIWQAMYDQYNELLQQHTGRSLSEPAVPEVTSQAA